MTLVEIRSETLRSKTENSRPDVLHRYVSTPCYVEWCLRFTNQLFVLVLLESIVIFEIGSPTRFSVFIRPINFGGPINFKK